MTTAKMTKFQKDVTTAVAAYAKGSAKLVRLFEMAATRYWNEDSRTVDNLQFFLNAIKDFPVLQKAAFESVKTFGKFDAQLENGVVSLTNKKVTDEQRKKYIEAVEAYVAMQYNSLLAAHNKNLLKAFDFDSRLKGFKNSAAAIVVNAVAEEKCTKEQAIQRLKDALAELETVDFEEKIQARKEELAAEKITGEQLAAAVANTETATENVA